MVRNACAVLALFALGCADDGCNQGTASGDGGAGGHGAGSGAGAGIDFDFGGMGGASSSNGFCGSSLVGTLRDFHVSHPDFEYVIAEDYGIVEPTLGADGKPVYAGGPNGTPTTHGKTTFDQWFHDSLFVNAASFHPIDLEPGEGGVFTYDDHAFFPLDGVAFGNEGNPHNYHFTFELHTKFLYEGGEIFRFTGDDDLFAFIAGSLVIDLGGVHGALSSEVSLDEVADELGLEVGGTYPLDIFFAERHTSESNFRIDTTLNFVDCGVATP
jgi:fibro-slime domain-containing protein